MVHDGSTDNTREVVNSIDDDRLRYIYQEKRGLAAGSNPAGLLGLSVGLVPGAVVTDAGSALVLQVAPDGGRASDQLMDSRMTVICLSNIPWDYPWQRTHALMTRFAQQCQVLIVEPTGIYNSWSLRKLLAAAQRLATVVLRHRPWTRYTADVFQGRILSPLIVPFHSLQIGHPVRQLNYRLLLWQISRQMALDSAARTIIWVTYPSDNNLDLARTWTEPRTVVYDCAAGYTQHPQATALVAQLERELVAISDLVLVDTRASLANFCAMSPRMHYLPQGVEEFFFEALPEDSIRAEVRRAVKAGPTAQLIGYVGSLHEWVDLSLLTRLAAAYPDAVLVLVGPIQTDVSQLRDYPNVRFLGSQPHRLLPRYIEAFDVGLIPYHIAPFTGHVFPTKLFEYLARGKPVVMTNFNPVDLQEYAELMYIALDADTFVAQVGEALAEAKPRLVAQRRQAAQANSWDRRFAAVVKLLAESG